jgi:hypothetical protein
MARDGKKVMQFLEGGRYVAVVADGKVCISTDRRINAAANHVTAISGQESGVFLRECYNPAVTPKRPKVDPTRNPTLTVSQNWQPRAQRG